MDTDTERGTGMFIQEHGVAYAVEELIAMQLADLKRQAEEASKETVNDFVITVPAYWNQWQRQAMLDAAKLANITRPILYNDNAAVALNFVMGSQLNKTVEHHILYDMGSGNTQVSLVGFSIATVKDANAKFSRQVPQADILAYSWDATLGGAELDFRVRDWLLKKFQTMYEGKVQGNIAENARARTMMLKEAVRAKEILSANTETMASVENIYQEQDFRVKITREELELMTKDLVPRVTAPVQEVLDKSGIQLVTEAFNMIL